MTSDMETYTVAVERIDEYTRLEEEEATPSICVSSPAEKQPTTHS